MSKRNCLVSFSGGETSGLMALLVLRRMKHLFAEIHVVFANTGQENEATLEFVHKCDTHFGLNVTWLETVVHPGKGHGSTHRVVTYETASRNGEPFEACIAKYGIPNVKSPHCTRELKLRPITSYIRNHLAWAPGSYDMCVGIRADEASRKAKNASSVGLLYPLCDTYPMSKPDVNTFWASQPFRLELAGYQGNCKCCWKKSMRKLLTIAQESPTSFEFVNRMEKTYSRVGPEVDRNMVDPSYRRTFFRGNLSADDILLMAVTSLFDAAEDDSVVYSGSVIELDTEPSDGCCTESCEVDFTEVIS